MKIQMDDHTETVQELIENEKFLKLFTELLKNADKERRANNEQHVESEKPTENKPQCSKTVFDVNDAVQNTTKKTFVNKSTTKNAITAEKIAARRLREKICEFQKLLDNLNTLLKIALETFTLCDDEPPLTFVVRSNVIKNMSFVSPNVNRDAHLLFAVKRVINSLRTDDIHDHSDQTELQINSFNRICVAGRALCRLIKCFTLRINNIDAVSLPHLFAFAISLSELCGRFLECIVQQPFAANTIKEFAKLVDNFQLEIVLGLREKRDVLLTVLNQKVEQLLSPKKPDCRPMKKLIYHRPDFRPKGYLLPLDLQRKRQTLQMKHSKSSQTTFKIAQPIVPPEASDAKKVCTQKRKLLTIPKYNVLEAEAYADKTRARHELNRQLFGLPVGTSTASFTENLAEELMEEIFVELEHELSTVCEQIVDRMYEFETN